MVLSAIFAFIFAFIVGFCLMPRDGPPFNYPLWKQLQMLDAAATWTVFLGFVLGASWYVLLVPAAVSFYAGFCSLVEKKKAEEKAKSRRA